MGEALSDLHSRRAGLETPEMAGLCGKFHSHITVVALDTALDRLRDVARTQQAKVTIIDLEGLQQGGAQRDVMLTRYHSDDAARAVGRIADALELTCIVLQEAGFPVARIKVEHESEPSLAVYDAERYHEVHIKLSIAEDAYERDYRWLLEQGAHLGWVASRNPLDRRQGHVLQFVTLRCYDGDRTAADHRVARVRDVILAKGLHILEIKRETTVLDTRRDHDRWWA